MISKIFFYEGVNMQWDDLQLINCKYDALYFYRHAKLANVLFTVELAERLKGFYTIDYVFVLI